MDKKLFLFEIKSQLKSIIIFTSICCVLFALFLLGMYSTFINAKEQVLPLFEMFPEEYLKAFGMDIDAFFSYIGICAFSYVYVGTVGAAMGMVTGLSIFARETRNKCVDFLLTKPIQRNKIFISKLCAASALVLASGIVFSLFAMLLYIVEGDGEFSIYMLIVLTFAATNIVFMAIGILLAIVFKRIKSVAAVAAGVVVLAFLMSAMQGVIDIEALKIISPLQYFSPTYIAANHTVQAWLAVVALLVTGGCIFTAHLLFSKKEF